MLLPWLLLTLAIGLVFGAKYAKAPEAVAGMFLGSGLLLLVAGLMLAGRWMRREGGETAQNLWQIAVRNITRRPSRSLAVIGMMAGGIFMVTAVNAFRMSAVPMSVSAKCPAARTATSTARNDLKTAVSRSPRTISSQTASAMDGCNIPCGNETLRA